MERARVRGRTRDVTARIEPSSAATNPAELDHARANTNAIAALGSAADGINALFSHHLRWALRRMRASFQGVEGFETADLAVGFVDLVGYTAEIDRFFNLLIRPEAS